MPKKVVLSVLFLSITNVIFAQSDDFYRSTGKIYGAYGVILILVLGLIAYLYTLDKKLIKIQRQLDNE